MKNILKQIFKPTLNLFDIICYGILFWVAVTYSPWFWLLWIPVIFISVRTQIKLGV